MNLLFIRDKHLSATELSEDRILLTASLNDTDQIIQLSCIVTCPELVIQEAKVDFTRYPFETCPGAAANIDNLVGLQIKPGFNKQVKQALGGNSGCVHMVDLAIEIGHVAVQAKLKRKEKEAELSHKDKREYWNDMLRGQCVSYPASNE